MPYTNTRRGIYTSFSSGSIKHGIPVILSNGAAGIASKQKARAWSDGLTNQAVIDASETFFLQTHGEVQVGTASGEAGNGDSTNLLAATPGTKVYIAPVSTSSGVSTWAVTTVSTSNTFLGRITETPSSPAVNATNRVPAAKVRIDLDARA
jgi:hypothetical protein